MILSAEEAAHVGSLGSDACNADIELSASPGIRAIWRRTINFNKSISFRGKAVAAKPSQHAQETAAWAPTIGCSVVSLIALVSLCFADEYQIFDFHAIWLSLSSVVAVAFATAAYLSSKSNCQEKLSACVAVVISAVILIIFSEQAKTLAFLAAARQFAMVLLAGAVTLLFETNLANKIWQRKHELTTAIVVAFAFGYPFLAQQFAWPLRDGMSDVTAIFAASTFGTMYIREHSKKKGRRRNGT